MAARFRFVRFLLPLLCLTFLFASPVPAAPAINADDELAVTKQAYDDLQSYLFKAPDNAALLTAAYDEAQKVLGTSDPELTLTGNATAEWNTFANGVRTLISESTMDVPTGTLRARMIAKMADAVNDGHTTYLTKTQYDRERAQVRGDTSQVLYGFSRVTVGNDVYIRTVIAGGNIEQAGARAGDKFVSIDGQQVTSDNAAMLFASPMEGSTHTIVVLHPGDTNPTTLMVTIKKFNVPTLTYKVVDGHIGYIVVSQFLTETPGKLDMALADLHSQGVDSLIVDVRDDPGGLATVLESFAGRFISNGTVLGTNTGRKTGSEDVVARSDRKPVDTLPLVVLANDYSGSASEYFTLAAREFRNAPIVGVTTAGGLGSAIVRPLRDGSGLEITVSEYVTAKGAKLNGIGVDPDVMVANPSNDDIINGRDPQLDAAIAQANMQVNGSSLLPAAA